MKIIAIGGGGFTHDTYPELDDFCLKQITNPRPRIAYIGTASKDDPQKIARFKMRFASMTEMQIHLPMTMNAAKLSAALKTVDLVYVGGGDTQEMVASWRRNGWDHVLREAYLGGVTLAGVSAGAVCWFEAFLFKPSQGPMRPVKGLGLISLGACPHYSTETDRAAALHKAVSADEIPMTIAIDDGVAVVFENAQPVEIYCAETDAGAYKIAHSSSGSTQETLSLV